MDQGRNDSLTSVTAGIGKLLMHKYEWKIPNYISYANLRMGSCINSPVFIISDSPWRLEMYPNGKDQLSEGYASLYLRMTNPNMYIRAGFIFYMIDSKNQTIAATHSTKVCVFKGNNAWGNGKFVIKSLLRLATNYSNVKLMCQIMNEEVSAHQEHVPSTMISKQLGCFVNNKQFSDVMFVVENRDIFAHKIVLCTQSPVFAAMFEHQMKENNDNIVLIEDISYEVFYELLSFIYSGHIEINNNITSELLKAADKYGLLKLKDICERKMCTNLSIDNILTCLDLADMYSANYLKKEAMCFVASHGKEIIHAPDFELLKNFNTSLLKEVFYAIASIKQ